MNNFKPKVTEIDNVYKFECGDHIYTYRIANKKEYSNEEFLNILLRSKRTSDYYNEPCTMDNDIDGWLVMFPRIEEDDCKFLNSVKVILKHTESDEKKQFINRLLNKCLIIDKEPVLLNGPESDPNKVNFLNIKEFGSYHIDNHKLKDIYRDTINYAAHQYVMNRLNHQGVYSKKEHEEIESLAKID